MKNKAKKSKDKAFSNISVRSFVTVILVLTALIFVCGALSYFIPQGSFERDENGTIMIGSYVQGEIDGIAPWRVLTAPVRVFFSEDALTVIMISAFLLVMSGVFNLLEKTGGVKIFIERIMSRFRGKNALVVCVTVLIFMLFGSFFGMFEELVTLLPIIIVFTLSMGLDTMTALGTCLLAACFGFAAAITNPFSVGLASEVAGVPTSDGVWLRIIFFAITYSTLCTFLVIHIRKIRKAPQSSPSYEVDTSKKNSLSSLSSVHSNNENKTFKVYAGFFAIESIILILVASVRAISSYAIPILAVSFLLFGTVAGLVVSERRASVARYLLQGATAMLPAVLMIALASSVKLIMTESGIIDTIMNYVIDLLDGKNKFIAIILIYILILFLQFFIGSASAKIILVMPIVMPIATALGLSPAIVILAYCMADGFTDVIMPTNPILLVALSMSNISYGKWVRWTWKLQLALVVLTLLTLFFGIRVGY